MQSIIAALQASGFSALPLNMRADGLTELEIGILGQRKVVIARSAFKPAPAAARAAFADLIALLARQPAACDD